METTIRPIRNHDDNAQRRTGTLFNFLIKQMATVKYSELKILRRKPFIEKVSSKRFRRKRFDKKVSELSLIHI